MTSLGAATVFFLGQRESSGLQRLMLGFSAGVMIASSVWSLLIPSIEAAEETGLPGWLPAAAGCALGAASLAVLNTLLPLLPTGFLPRDGSRSGRQTCILTLAITLHNIPEGMAVGVSFALAVQGDPAALAAAAALAFGVGIQNLPEGAAIALPLHQSGLSRRKSFLIGTLSGAAEPAAALLTVLLASSLQQMLPWLLAYAAGAMLYVVVEELIPEANLPNSGARNGTLGVMAGFLVMMILDVALGA